MHRIVSAHFLFCLAILVQPWTASSAITIATVPVGDVGNANDPLTGNLYGSVNYAYNIGATEVTNAQYAVFLNEKAKSDPLELYNPNMGSFDHYRGGISRSGVSGSYVYSVKDNMGDKPVNFVSWYDSIRFANWLNNGQGTGDTETGAYTLGALSAGGIPTGGLDITRNVGATWFLPSENEWYKSAYYQPAAQGGDADNYWAYPTASNSLPTTATANSVGDISNPGTNVANYNLGANWNGQAGNVTTVGSAGPLAKSYYGTDDQGGNVWEWNEALTTLIGIDGSFRGVRGGSWDYFSVGMQASYRNYAGNPAFEG